MDPSKIATAKQAVIRDLMDSAWAKILLYVKYQVDESEETRLSRIRVILVLVATAELVRQTGDDWPLGRDENV